MYKISPESGCNSGFAYPVALNVMVLPPANVTVFAVPPSGSGGSEGVPCAFELAPVI